MKTLQNEFTTPEQSKRLMEVGVPVDSADCYYLNVGHVSIRQGIERDSGFFSSNKIKYMPCWSVGRLIEIICKVRTHYISDSHLVFNFKDGALDNMTEAFIKTLECDYNDGCIDFSKLEE